MRLSGFSLPGSAYERTLLENHLIYLLLFGLGGVS